MERYHKKVGFKPEHIRGLQDITEQLNLKNWGYSEHCLDNLKFRFLDLKGVLLFIKGIKLDYGGIFEYYADDKNIIKLCYRINYNQLQDIILVLTPDKKIITLYINSTYDLHDTLKKNLYSTLTK